MRVKYSPSFLRTSKRLNVRVRKGLKEKLAVFIKDHQDPQLDNHQLKDKWQGYSSIDITTDYRAIYREILEGKEVVAYFVTVGTHEQLYRRN